MLNNKQKEIYNYQKIAAVLADYGFNCIKLADDWNGADFLAYHKDGQDTLKVQLKGRLTISKKYIGKDLYMSFPVNGDWFLIEHDRLLDIIQHSTDWLHSNAWQHEGNYHSAKPSKALIEALTNYMLS